MIAVLIVVCAFVVLLAAIAMIALEEWLPL